MYTPWMQDTHCMPWDFPCNFSFDRKYKIISQVWFKLPHNEHASSIVQRSADVWRYCILDSYSHVIKTSFVWTARRWKHERQACTWKVHALAVSAALNVTARIFTISLLAAIIVIASHDNAVDWHKQQQHHKSLLRLIITTVSPYCFVRELSFFLLQQNSLLKSTVKVIK
jgi:hypothetical protein